MKIVLVLFAFLVSTEQLVSGGRKPKLHGRLSEARLRVTGRWDIFVWTKSLAFTPGKIKDGTYTVNSNISNHKHKHSSLNAGDFVSLKCDIDVMLDINFFFYLPQAIQVY